MEGHGGAARLGTWIFLSCSAAWLTLVTGQQTIPPRNRQLERDTVVVTVTGGVSNREGVVELLYQNQRGKLCDIGITRDDVAVLCRMLGYQANGGGEYRLVSGISETVLFPAGSQRSNYILYGLECNKTTDNSIADCDFEPGVQWFDPGQCVSRTNDVAIQCFGAPITATPAPPPAPTQPSPSVVPTIPGCTPSPNVRLTGLESDDTRGLVTVRRGDGSFGGVCDNGWGREDAQVVCRMLCYDPAFAQANINQYGPGSAPVYLTEVNCQGNEDDILDCSSTIATTNDCNFVTEAAAVSCVDDISSTDSLAPAPIVECDNSRITARFSRELEPRLRTEYLSPLANVQPDCGYTESIDANFVTIFIPFVGCETQRITNNTHITYRNTIRHNIPSDTGIITRNTAYLIEVTCVIARESTEQSNVEPQGQPAPPAIGTGEFNINLELYRSNVFNSPVRTFPARVTLGDWLYVGVSLNTQDQSLRLIVPRCTATADNDRNSQPNYLLLDNKCRVDSSLTFYAFNDTFFAYRFRTFKFVGDRPFVYIHCTSYVCGRDENDVDCDRSCNDPNSRGKRSVSTSWTIPLLGGSGRSKRDITRTLWPSDKGPIEFEDQSGNLIQLNRELEKPSRPILTGGSSHLSGCTILTATICLIYHLLR